MNYQPLYRERNKDAPDRVAALRLHETKNNQRKGIRWAKDYELRKKPVIGLEPMNLRITRAPLYHLSYTGLSEI